MLRISFLMILLNFISSGIYSQRDSLNLNIDGSKTGGNKSMPEVFIKAIRKNVSSHTSYSIIDPKQISHLNLGQDIPTLIQQLPGFNMSSDAGNGIGYSYLYIRGMDAQRIQVNINGVPYNDAESQEVYWVNIPDIMSSADDIQVQRGVGFSTMGGTGLGGSISIKTTKKYDKPFLTLGTSIGSFNTMKNTLNMSTGILENGWQITTRGSLIRSEGFIDRASSRMGSLYLDISKYGDNFTSHLIATHGRERTYQSWYGLSQEDYEKGLITKNIAGTDYESKEGSPYPDQVDNYQQSHIQWINNFLWKQGHQSSLTGYFSRGKGYYEEYKVAQDYSQLSKNLIGNGDLVRQLWLNNFLYGVNASHIVEKSNWSNTTGASYNHYLGYHYGRISELLSSYTGSIPNEFYYNTSNKIDMSMFNKLSFTRKNTNFVLDLQVRNVMYDAIGSLRSQANVDFDKNFLFFNPKIGSNIRFAKGDLKYQIYTFLGLSHREPVRSDFLDEETLRKPLPEKVYNLEIGFKINKRSPIVADHRDYLETELKTNIFAMYFIDQLIPTGNVNSVGAPIRENVNRSYRVGAELEFSHPFSKRLSIYLNQYLALNKILDYTNYLIAYNEDYSINDSKTVKQNFSSTDIAFSPSWISYLEIRYSPWKNTNLRIMNKIVSSQYLDNTASALKSLPMYSFTNASISHTMKVSKTLKEIELNLLLNNIFNTINVTRGYTYFSGNTVMDNGSVISGRDYNYYFPQAGFNFLMGVNMKW